ncbi:MAG: sugar porter family MFS transporter [Acidobacteria bacterium]|nr:sugar porter family MFS transporter [Acidobacteriota bacterium]
MFATRAPESTRPNQKVFVVVLACVAALGGLLFGYDTAVISGALGFLRIHFDLDAVRTGWAASCTLVGCVIGAGVSGLMSDSFGRRRVMFFSAIMFLISAVGSAIAVHLTWFVVFRILGGLGIGAASMASPLYIAEIAPARWRGRLISLNQFAIVSGMLLVYLVNYQIARMGSETWNISIGWRWMLGSGALPAILLFGCLFLVPETPRFLALKGRQAEALAVAARIEDSLYFDLESRRLAISENREVLFQPNHPLGRRLTIGIILAIFQQITGINVFLYYAPQIFAQLGSGANVALLQTVAIGAVNLVFTIVAMGMVDRVGRRTLLMLGSFGMGICLAAMGLALLKSAFGAWQIALVLGYIACFALSVGPVTWIVLAEIFPAKTRGRAMGIATIALWAANFVVSQTFPMMNESQYLIARFQHGFPFFLYALFCFLELIFVWRVLPETTNRSLEDISDLWDRPGGSR